MSSSSGVLKLDHGVVGTEATIDPGEQELLVLKYFQGALTYFRAEHGGIVYDHDSTRISLEVYRKDCQLWNNQEKRRRGWDRATVDSVRDLGDAIVFPVAGTAILGAREPTNL